MPGRRRSPGERHGPGPPRRLQERQRRPSRVLKSLSRPQALPTRTPEAPHARKCLSAPLTDRLVDAIFLPLHGGVRVQSRTRAASRPFMLSALVGGTCATESDEGQTRRPRLRFLLRLRRKWEWGKAVIGMEFRLWFKAVFRTLRKTV